MSTLSAIVPKSLAENTAFVFTNVASPLSWNESAITDTIPDVLGDVPRFLLDNPVALQKRYLALKGDSSKKKLWTGMRREMLVDQDRALEMLVKLFDWLGGLRSHATAEMVYQHNLSLELNCIGLEKKSISRDHLQKESLNISKEHVRKGRADLIIK